MADNELGSIRYCLPHRVSELNGSGLMATIASEQSPDEPSCRSTNSCCPTRYAHHSPDAMRSWKWARRDQLRWVRRRRRHERVQPRPPTHPRRRLPPHLTGDQYLPAGPERLASGDNIPPPATNTASSGQLPQPPPAGARPQRSRRQPTHLRAAIPAPPPTVPATRRGRHRDPLRNRGFETTPTDSGQPPASVHGRSTHAGAGRYCSM
jgi:hypothetical protein